MKGAIIAILEVAAVVVPLVIAAFFLLRKKETYDEKYGASYFKSWGISRRKYRAFNRILGVLFLLLAAFIVYKLYIEEPTSDYDESRQWWNELNSTAGAMMLGSAIAIPTRMSSKRFPGKALALLGGKAVIERVYGQCKKSELAEKIVILTDSLEIQEFSENMGAQVIMTSETCNSGTERIIEAFGEINADFVVNVQGDEPFIDPKLIDAIIQAHQDGHSDLVTAGRKIESAQALINPNVVKILRDDSGDAIYFSRSPLPYMRGEPNPEKWLEKFAYWQHIGIYGYSAKALARYSSLPESPLEKCEMLEQLRYIAAGYKFEVIETEYASIGIDTPEDLAEAEEFLKRA